MQIRTAYLLEGIRLDGPIWVAPFRITPVPLEQGYSGRDLREIMNQELARTGFVTMIEPWTWGPQIAPRRRLATAVTDPEEINSLSEKLASTQFVVGRLLDPMALTNGGSPRLVAGVTELSDGANGWRTLGIEAGSGPWPGSVLERLVGDHQRLDQLCLSSLWHEPARDPRAALWVSLHRGVAAEPRWDVRLFRLFSLLETIAKQVIPGNQPLHDRDGRVLLAHDGRPATSTGARGRIYQLITVCLHALELSDQYLRVHPEQDLWGEVGIWTDVRNAVAHQGGWWPALEGQHRSTRQERVTAAFRLAGRGDDLASGWSGYSEAAAAAAELALRAAMAGRLSGRSATRDR